jgi:hypothetical protein
LRTGRNIGDRKPASRVGEGTASGADDRDLNAGQVLPFSYHNPADDPPDLLRLGGCAGREQGEDRQESPASH